MATLVRKLSTITRCINMYRNDHSPEDLPGVTHGYIFAIYHNPGKSQDWLAKHMFLNKSTVARHLAKLEQTGYIVREASKEDKRELLVYPTDKLKNIYPDVRDVTLSWNNMISEAISKEELESFNTILDKILEKSIDFSEKEVKK